MKFVRKDVLKFGTNEIGTPFLSGEGTCFRIDTYTSAKTGEVSKERRFALNRADDSPLFLDGATGHYDSRCSCCYLNFSHTVEEHKSHLNMPAAELLAA